MDEGPGWRAEGGEAGSSGGGGGGGDTSMVQLAEECEQETSCRVVEGGEGRGEVEGTAEEISRRRSEKVRCTCGCAGVGEESMMKSEGGVVIDSPAGAGRTDGSEGQRKRVHATAP